MSRNFPVSGGKAIEAALNAVGKRMATQVIRSGLTAAANPVLAEARLRASDWSPKVAAAITKGSSRKNQDGTFSIRIKAETAASLEGVYNSIPGLTGSSTSASATADSATSAASQSTSSSASSSTDVGAAIVSLTDKVEQLRADMNSGNATIASGVNRAAKVLENVSPNGDAISVANG